MDTPCLSKIGVTPLIMGTSFRMYSTSASLSRTCVPALAPPACSEVRPGNTPITSVPHELKIMLMARSNPEPKASRITTVAMPHRSEEHTSELQSQFHLV